jgi:hypothetical protein
MKCALLIFIFAIAAVTVFGQTGSSTLVGTVTDPQDSVVPNAKVQVMEAATGITRSASSNEAGLFRVLDLKPGRYSVRVESPSFKTLQIADIVLASTETRDLGRVVLQVGAVTESVEVAAVATPVQTASSERSALIDSNQLETVALKGRDPFGFIGLLPGVVDMATDRSASSSSAATNIFINGMASNTKNISFDGVTELDQGGANAVYVAPNMDAIGEIRVLTNAYQAENGRTAGGGINMITKSGTRDFHGSIFWNRRHEDMNANTFFNNRQKIQRPIYRYFVGGYSIGGPVYIPHLLNQSKQRLFFFMSQEWTRIAQPTTTSMATLPTLAERSGDFSQSVNSLGAQIAIKDPSTGAQFPGNIIPSDRIDKTGQGLLNLFAKPNGYVNPTASLKYSYNFLASETPDRRRSDSIVRIDAVATSKMNIYARYGYDTSDTTVPFAASPGVGWVDSFLPGYNWSGHIVNTISPSMVNEIVIGVGHNNNGNKRTHGDQDSNYYRTSSLNPPTLRPFPTGPMYEPYLPMASFSGGSRPNPGSLTPGTYAGGGNTIPYKNFNDTYTIQDDLTKLLGNHSLKAGVYYEYNSKIEPMAGTQYAGNFNFGSNAASNPLDSGDGYSNALLGIFQTYTEASNRNNPNPHFVEAEGYVQDNWRLSRRVTIDAGLRWYHIGLMKDDSGSFSAFYPQLWNPAQAARIYRPATVGGKTVAMDPLTGATTYAALQNTIVPGSGSAVNGMHINGLSGNGDFAEFPFLNFSPRLGFAWDVFGNGKMAVRGSFGTFFNRPNANYVAGLGAPPIVYSPVVYYSYVNQIAQAAASAAISPTSAATTVGPQKMERNHQFNLTIQRDIGFGTVVDVAYVGNFDRHGLATYEWNPVPRGAYADPANIFNNTELNQNLLRTRFPGMGSIIYSSGSNSPLDYHGLQVQAQHRMNRGLQFGVTYGFSKSLGTCPARTAFGSGYACTMSDPNHSYREWFYGPLSQDINHVLSINYTYQIKPITDYRILRHVIGDWTLAGVTTASTGAPLTPTCTSSSAGAANSDPSLSGMGAFPSNQGGARCQAVADPKSFTHSFYSNFNTSAFTLAPAGTWGNIGLGILRQPSRYNFDLTLNKTIPLGKSERRSLGLRIEAYNLFNHTEFSTINASLQLSGANNLNTLYGQYTATLPSRVLSTTIRLQF